MRHSRFGKYCKALDFEYKIQCRKYGCDKYCKILIFSIKYNVASLGAASTARFQLLMVNLGTTSIAKS